MGGRFGKLGDAKRKALIRKNRLTPPVPGRPGKDKPFQRVRKRKRAWSASEPVGMIGHIAILYRMHNDPQKGKIIRNKV